MRLKNLLFSAFLSLSAIMPIASAEVSGIEIKPYSSFSERLANYPRLESKLGCMKHNGIKENYAVLINGFNYPRYQDNMSLAYITLLDKGFKPENIFIFEDLGEDEGFNFFKKYKVDAPAMKDSIETFFIGLSDVIDNEDLLFVYTTGHGDTEDIKVNANISIETSTLNIPGKDINAIDLKWYLSMLSPKVGIIVSDQCFSGGFAKMVGNGPYVAISASSSSEGSWGVTFPRAFFSALDDHLADFNQDGRISLFEAFEYTLASDRNAVEGNHSPSLVSEINSSKVFLE